MKEEAYSQSHGCQNIQQYSELDSSTSAIRRRYDATPTRDDEAVLILRSGLKAGIQCAVLPLNGRGPEKCVLGPSSVDISSPHPRDSEKKLWFAAHNGRWLGVLMFVH